MAALRPPRIYLDAGDDNFDANAALCRLLQSRSYVLGRDLRCDYRPGHAHHPAHFAAGPAPMLRFLLPG
jgi:hypothetical protein